MATFEDIQRKHAQFITSQNNIIDMIASYGVGIDKDTPFQQYASLVKEIVANVFESVLEGLSGKSVPFDITERELKNTTVIRRYALYNNINLKSLIVPDNVTSIDPNAFYGCTGLSTVKFPKGIRLQASCFNGCTGLLKVFLPKVESSADVPTIGNLNAFSGIHQDCIFYAPDAESLAIYQTATNWCDLYSNYEFKIEEAE